MSTLRFKAIIESLNRKPIHVEETKIRSEIFGKNVFTESSMRRYLTKDSYNGVMDAIEKGSKIPKSLADDISSGMKEWAISRGATHFTHWFQPLTGSTAEKHDAFFEILENSDTIEKIAGTQLIQQEMDASGFPSGGIRNTFETRGYTAWDPTSPAFIYKKTLCIPTVFVSYTGEALDNKTPLLRALQEVGKAATDVAKYFDKDVKKVNITLGWEQEYFLVDSALAASRPDIMQAGRTLMGHRAAKGQQLNDHYLGATSSRVLAYMQDLEKECMLLGIPVKTRHNEAAPNQFEIAPIFEEANLAVDHNSLLMDLMKRVAERHSFVVLLHEKPFEGVSGSGKHNNWSLLTDTGINLLKPGATPIKNLQFLTFFINTIKAVNDYEELLSASVASAGNDLRLNGWEAPSNILSISIGTDLAEILDEIEKSSNKNRSEKEKPDSTLNVVGKIPEILLDSTDRNRTSPFAFIENKFEFRSVGSSANCAHPMTILNTIVTNQLWEFKKSVEALRAEKIMRKDDAIFAVLQEYVRDSKKIRFEGDGYSKAWEAEAEKRGLSNFKNAPEALKIKVSKKSIDLFERIGVMNQLEIEARYAVELNDYAMRLQIESRVVADLTRNHIIPAAIKYQNILLKNLKGIKEIYPENFEDRARQQLKLMDEVSGHIDLISNEINQMTISKQEIDAIQSIEEKAFAYCHVIKPLLMQIRYHSDQLELLVDDELWPLTKYRELLFTS